MSNQVFFAPPGTPPSNLAVWTPVGVTVAQIAYEQPQAEEDWFTWGFADKTFSLSFTMSRRDIRRVMKLIPRTKADLRRSAMRSAYRRRRRTR